MSASEDLRDATADASDQGESGTKSLARKDRACPFCKQPFTSSSLGRHLDLYIKDKNPKAPDGIHDIVQIKEIRRGITRRHARSENHVTTPNSAGNNAKRTVSVSLTPLRHSSPAASTPSRLPAPAPLSSAILSASLEPKISMQAPSPGLDHHAERQKVPLFNRMNWQATGVINDLPPRPSSSLSRDLPRPDLGRMDQDHNRYRTMEETDTNQAAELALTEVLEQIQAAKARIKRDPLFDFAFASMSFPALCIRVLPASSSLFSTMPLPTPDTCPLETPGQDARDAISRVIKEKLKYSSHNYLTPSDNPYLTHLSHCYHQYVNLHREEQLSIWHLELHRVYNTANTNLQSATCSIEQLQRENEVLRTQIERLREAPSMQPWQKSLFPPPPPPTSLPPLSTAVSKELAQTVDDRAWDYSVLIDKWKKHIKSAKGPLISSTVLGARDASQSVRSVTHSPSQPMHPMLNKIGSVDRYGTAMKFSAFGHPGTPLHTTNGASRLGVSAPIPAPNSNRNTGMRIAELVNNHADSRWQGTKRARAASVDEEEENGHVYDDDEDRSDEEGDVVGAKGEIGKSPTHAGVEHTAPPKPFETRIKHSPRS